MGVATVLFVQATLWPESAQAAVREADPKIISAMATELKAAFAPFSGDAFGAQDGAVAAKEPPAATVKLCTKALGAMPLAKLEPVLWCARQI